MQALHLSPDLLSDYSAWSSGIHRVRVQLDCGLTSCIVNHRRWARCCVAMLCAMRQPSLSALAHAARSMRQSLHGKLQTSVQHAAAIRHHQHLH